MNGVGFQLNKTESGFKTQQHLHTSMRLPDHTMRKIWSSVHNIPCNHIRSRLYLQAPAITSQIMHQKEIEKITLAIDPPPSRVPSPSPFTLKNFPFYKAWIPLFFKMPSSSSLKTPSFFPPRCAEPPSKPGMFIFLEVEGKKRGSCLPHYNSFFLTLQIFFQGDRSVKTRINSG